MNRRRCCSITVHSIGAALMGWSLLWCTAGRSEEPVPSQDSPAHHEHGRFQGVDNSWPPQPLDMTSIKWGGGSRGARQANRKTRLLQTAERKIRRQAKALLGPRPVLVSVDRMFDKTAKGDAGPVCATYINKKRNRTVELVLERSGKVRTTKDTALSTYQPELTANEIAEAIKLAQAELLAKGFDRVSALKGYGILAYKPNDDHGFYKDRVVYVSFHEHQSARPEFNALVDLTKGSVLESKEDRF